MMNCKIFVVDVMHLRTIWEKSDKTLFCILTFHEPHKNSVNKLTRRRQMTKSFNNLFMAEFNTCFSGLQMNLNYVNWFVRNQTVFKCLKLKLHLLWIIEKSQKLQASILTCFWTVGYEETFAYQSQLKSHSAGKDHCFCTCS